MAPQLTGINGPLLRDEQPCSALATSSLPVPLSPIINTVASLGPTTLIRERSSSMSRLRPIIEVNSNKNHLLALLQQ